MLAGKSKETAENELAQPDAKTSERFLTQSGPKRLLRAQPHPSPAWEVAPSTLSTLPRIRGQDLQSVHNQRLKLSIAHCVFIGRS